jgi:hypothetical protein
MNRNFTFFYVIDAFDAVKNKTGDINHLFSLPDYDILNGLASIEYSPPDELIKKIISESL